jgi:DNA-binding SARP family transcriptional activator
MPISLSLLNGFQLEVGACVTDLPLASQRLVAFVACQQKPVQRSFVAGNLWGDKSDSRAGANLRSALWRIGEFAHDLIESTGTVLRLGRRVSVDLRRATGVAEQVVRGDNLGVSPIDVTRMCAAELLPDWYDDWLVLSREEFRQLRLHALEVLADDLTRDGRPADAVDAALAAIRVEPLRESAHRLLIAAHLANGNVCEALRHYERFTRSLGEQLGLPPSPRLERMMSPIFDEGRAHHAHRVMAV